MPQPGGMTHIFVNMENVCVYTDTGEVPMLYLSNVFLY